jgi:pyruvate,water dikinase
MMTDPIKPLGLSFFLLTTPAPMRQAGGRLFVDVTHQLASPARRTTLLNAMGQHDPLMKDALMTIIERGDFIKSLPNDNEAPKPARGATDDQLAQIESKPSIVFDLIKRSETSIEELKQTI